jgi:hypothetical protein
MPSFAKDDPRDYWQATDNYERSNARLFVEVEFALPKELQKEERIQLAQTFAKDLTKENHLPYTLAIHQGKGHNPHAHLVISERQNDGIERSDHQWFRRANKEHPEQGGALKSQEFHGSHYIKQIREQWAEKANTALEHSGSKERIDHRTLEAQGIDRTPTQHIGPTTYAMAEKGIKNERLKNLEHQRGEEKSIERELQHAERRIERQLRQIARDSEPSQQQHQPHRDQPHRDHPGHTHSGRDPESGKQDKQPQRQYDQGLEL